MKHIVWSLGLVSVFLPGCENLIGFGARPHADDGSADGGHGVDAATVVQDAGGATDAATRSEDASYADVSIDAADGPVDADDGSRTDSSDSSVCSTDFYVPGPGDCSFPSITLAIAAARSSSARARTIHVAAGSYDAKTGETFPLDLRGGISLVGEGQAPADTVIVGLGPINHAVEGGELDSTHATIAIGSPDTTSRVTNLRILSGEDVSVSQGLGIYCDQGNAVPSPGPQPPPNLIVDHVSVEHGYAVGVLVSSSTYPRSGCNASITATSFNAAWAQFTWLGVAVGGCDTTSSPAPTALTLGDGIVAHGNTFEDMGKGDGSAGAVLGNACTSSLVARANVFDTGEAGVIINTPPAARVEIVDNSFTTQANGGIRIMGKKSVISQVARNSFTACDFSAIWAQHGSSGIQSARDNTFIGNRHAVTIEGDVVSGTFDFGTLEEPGGNQFRCNSANDTEGGYDFGQLAPAALGGLVTAYGNLWDHAPPTASAQPTTGLDIVLPPSGSSPNTGGARLGTATCPTGANPGP